MSLVARAARNHRQKPVDDAIDCRETPSGFFDALHAEHSFTVDVAANPNNAKLPRFYDLASDGLSRSWSGETVWCNPPYSELRPWVTKAHAEVRSGCRKVVMLLPANRTEQPWWQDLIEPIRDRGLGVTTKFVRTRLRFKGAVVGADARAPNENRPPFGCVLVVFEPPPELSPWERVSGPYPYPREGSDAKPG